MRKTLITLSSLLLVSLGNAQNIQQGLLAHYNFANNATDLSGNNNNGTPTNVLSVEDRFGQANGAYKFNTGYVNLGPLAPSNQMSFSFWTKSNTPNNGFILENYNWRINRGIAVSLDSEFDLRFSGRVGTSTYYSTETANVNIFDNQWHHIVAVMDQSVWSIYIDGILSVSVDHGYATADIVSGDSFYIGNWFLDGVNQNRYYQGILDDFRIYNRVLTGADITALYNLVSDNNGGDKVNGSGTGNDGTWSSNNNGIYYNSGNVAIGTSKSDAPLTVNGSIHAKEVKVDLAVPAPDYVFKEDYPLRSLEALSDYLNTYSHLPEVPSAKYMEENGVELGEMNMILLKKIEELTLYQLQQNEEIKALKMLISTLIEEGKDK